jgi:hypothetical protein
MIGEFGENIEVNVIFGKALGMFGQAERGPPGSPASGSPSGEDTSAMTRMISPNLD